MARELLFLLPTLVSPPLFTIDAPVPTTGNPHIFRVIDKLITMARLGDIAESKSSTYQARSIMAIANLGVSVMEEGRFSEALEVFKVAFCAVDVYVPGGGEFGDVFVPSQNGNIEKIQSFAKSQLVGASVPLAPIQVCPCDDEDANAIVQLLPVVAIFAPIRLRSRKFYDALSSNINLCLAIMMLNHGIAHLLAHVQDRRHRGNPTVSSTEHDAKLLRGADVCFNCAQVMVDRHLDILPTSNDFERLVSQLVSASALKNMLWMFRLQNQDCKVEQVQAMLSQVLSDVEMHEERLRAMNADFGTETTACVA